MTTRELHTRSRGGRAGRVRRTQRVLGGQVPDRRKECALFGRAAEQRHIDRMLADARTGRSSTAVIRGEAGIGKTALLEYAARNTDEMRVLRGVGVEAEAEQAFAGLHLLLASYADALDELPEPQAEALRGAFGRAPASGLAGRFLVGLATLSLLAELAEEPAAVPDR